MMRRNSMWGILALTTVLATGLVWSGNVEAGHFQRFTGSNLLPAGGSITLHATPRNQNSAMEIDVYEFQTVAATDSWRCFISQNSTGQDLTLRLIGLAGTPLASCTTPVNGTCATTFVALGGNFLFQCTVSSGAFSPVVSGGHYIVGVQR